MPDTGGTLKKTTHKTIGHAPAALADYETAFSPNTASGGWHRGDGCFSTHGTGWSMYGFNDFFVSDGAGGVNIFYRHNSVLLVDNTTGIVSWLSSGDQFPLAGAVTFPAPDASGTFCWLLGGWATGATSAILFAHRWTNAYALQDYRVMQASAFTGSSPLCGAVVTTDLSITAAAWSGQPYVDGSHVYVYGAHFASFSHRLARHAWSATASDYATGWEYWTGSAWSTNPAQIGALVIESAPLRALTVRAWEGGYLASGKVFDVGPELGIPDDWPEIRGWWSPNVTGPFEYVGVLYQPVTLTDWFSYSARVEELPGVSGTTALWSLNKGSKSIADHGVYGPQLAAMTTPYVGTGQGSGVGSRAVSGSGSASLAVVGSGPGSAAGVGAGSVGHGRAGSPSGSHGE